MTSTESAAIPRDGECVNTGDEDADAVAIRQHLGTVMLKLAAAQAGSVEAAKDARKHVEAVLEILDARRGRARGG